MNIPSEMLEDFRNHVWACFKYLGLGDPTPAQYAMADALQKGAKDMQLQAGRGFGKSVITSCLASWFLLKDPNSTIMVVVSDGLEADTTSFQLTVNAINDAPSIFSLIDSVLYRQ